MKLGRNDPCWCNSGRKYKHCHLDRERRPPLTVQEIINRRKSAWKHRTCLHPDAPTGCKGKIVEAHTIQRGGGLDRIARAGHVYHFKSSYPQIRESGGLLVPALVGVKQASIFSGFCARHDQEVFRPIETRPIIPTAEQTFLLAYRAFCREFFQKERIPAFVPTLREMDRGKDAWAQREIQGMAAALEAGNARGRRDGLQHKAAYDDVLLKRDFTSVRFLAFALDRPPDVMCSGAYSPEFDFGGQGIQDVLSVQGVLDVVTFTLAATTEGGIALLAWLGEQPACEAFAASLAALPDARVPDALVRLAFEAFENTVASPCWWDGLSEREREVLLERMNEGGLPAQRREGLVDDGQRVARWSVIRRIDCRLPESAGPAGEHDTP